MSSYSIIAKHARGKEYLFTFKDAMATKLSKAQWEKLREKNKELFKDTETYIWMYIPAEETDFSWWDRITRELTPTAIKEAYFECDFYGNVTKYY